MNAQNTLFDNIPSQSKPKAKQVPQTTTEVIISHLNTKANTKYRATTKKTIQLINARFKDGYELQDFLEVINKKCNEWIGGEFEKYLQPETLFGNKFEKYLNQKIIKPKKKKSDHLNCVKVYEGEDEVRTLEIY